MQASYFKSAVFWIFLLAAIPFWLCLIWCFNLETDFNWFREHLSIYLYAGLLLPVIEEIVFRGFIQGQLEKFLGVRRIGVLSYANILTSLIFTAVHFLNHPPAWAILVLIPSLIFGYFRDKDNTLVTPVILHVFYNAGYFLIFGAAD